MRRLVLIPIILMLVSSSIPVTASDTVNIEIKGGWGITIIIENNGEEIIDGAYTICLTPLFGDGDEICNGNAVIPISFSFLYQQSFAGRIGKVDVDVTSHDDSLSKSGICIFGFVFFR